MDTGGERAAKAEALFEALLLARIEGRPVDAGAWLAEHARFRDLLEPMLAADEAAQADLAGLLESIPQARAEGLAAITGDPVLDELRRVILRLAARPDSADRLIVGRPIGQGGMGEVLEGYDDDLRRTLAVKRMRSIESPLTSTSPVLSRSIARFLAEARITGQLDHPGIPPVHELGLDANGRLFFTMRLIRGRSLQEIFGLADQGRDGWSTTRSIGVVLRACEAMAYAHSRGVIHRDLKPSNVMVGEFGEVYVMDWGLAKTLKSSRAEPSTVGTGGGPTPVEDSTDSSPELTLQGHVLGTAAYMSPEQARGDTHLMGPRSDVYSMGAMLYELLSGRRPYCDTPVPPSAREVVEAVKSRSPRPVLELRPHASPELAKICEKAMSLDPARRYESMLELSEDLRAYLEGRVVHAFESGRLAELKKLIKRNKAVTASLLVIGALVGSGIAVQYGQKRVREVERTLVNRARLTAAHASLVANEVPEGRRLLDDVSAPARGEWMYRHLRLMSDTSLATLAGHASGVASVSFAPTGGRLATISGTGALRVWDVTDPLGPFLLGGFGSDHSGNPDRAVAVSPDCRRAAFITDDFQVGCWDLDFRARRLFSASPDQLGVSIALTPDSDLVAVGREDGSVQVIDSESGDCLWTRRKHVKSVRSMTFSPDGKLLASGSVDGTVLIWDLAAGEPLSMLSGEIGRVRCLAFHPTGAELVTGSEDGWFRVWSVPESRMIDSFQLGPASAKSLSYAEEGRALVIGCADGTLRLVDARDGSARATLRGHAKPVTCVGSALTDGLFASGSEDGEVKIWDARLNQPFVELRGHAYAVHHVAISRDGRFIATGSDDQSVMLWIAETGEPYAALTGLDAAIVSVAFSSDGSRVAAAAESGAARVWSVESGQELEQLEGVDPRDRVVAGAAFSPDLGLIARANRDEGVTVLDLASKRIRGNFRLAHESSRIAMAFGPGENLLAVAGAGPEVLVWGLETDRAPRIIGTADGVVRALAFSPDGSRLYAGGEDRQVHVFETRTSRRLGSLRGHADVVRGIAVGEDGARIVTVSDDRTVRIWDGTDFARPDGTDFAMLMVLRGHEGEVHAVACSSELVVSGSTDGTGRAWIGRPGISWVADARQSRSDREAARNLVQPLFDQGRTAAEVIRTVESDKSLPSQVHEAALRLARVRTDSADILGRRAYSVGVHPARTAGEYAEALENARLACRLEPNDSRRLSTLGMALYRNRRYQECVEALTQASALRGEREEGLEEDLAFLAMAHACLERLDEADRALEKLRQKISAQAHPRMHVCPLWREAEDLVKHLATELESTARR